jgi:hypothetical protein
VKTKGLPHRGVNSKACRIADCGRANAQEKPRKKGAAVIRQRP